MRHASLIHLSFAAAVVLFLLAPHLDLLVSRTFYLPGHGFWMAGQPDFQNLRQLFRHSANAVGYASGLLLLASLAIGPGRQVPARLWGYGFATMALGPGVAVNLILKPLWGRARPANDALFGGAHHFTPVFRIADQCSWGCSFVSGEAAGAMGAAIVIGVLLWPGLTRRGRGGMVALLAAFVIATAGLRVAMGRHFLSDVIFGALLSAYTGWALYHVFRLSEVRGRLTLPAFKADARAFARRLTGH
ncbi:phosphatase PAP2 family protein [Solirhodobacter olei]|uniref:phosphatase PAP2 family protein n=1 Tax=Solirhodobacter olei TaxID=2493082 RepID=UPI000FDA1FA0|nr:phosphatase PAP2 family protein [Solirhodobacter olei]